VSLLKKMPVQAAVVCYRPKILQKPDPSDQSKDDLNTSKSTV